MAGAGDDVGCVAGEAGVGVMVGDVAVVSDKWPGSGRNRAVAASAGVSIVVPGVLTGARSHPYLQRKFVGATTKRLRP